MQDDAGIYSRLKLILAEHRQAARHSAAVATAAAVVQLSKRHGFSGDFAPPDDLVLVWANVSANRLADLKSMVATPL